MRRPREPEYPASAMTSTPVAAPLRVKLQGNARGLRAEDRSTVVASNSIATGNDAIGFVALVTTNAVDMTLEKAVSSRNGQTGVNSGAIATVRISNVASIQDNVGLQSVGGGAIISFGNNRVHRNVGGDGMPTSTPGRL